MAVYIRDVIALAPEFASLEPDAIQSAIDAAASVTWPGFWDEKLDTATMYLAAHYLAVSYPGAGSPGAVTEETVGPITRRYAINIKPTDDELQSTRFGRFYARMVDENPNSHFMVV